MSSDPALAQEELKAFERVFELAVQYINANSDRDEPIVRFKTPDELRSEFDFKMNDEGLGFTNILGEIEKILKYSVRTGHVRFFNQLWAGTDKAAVIGEWLTAIMNSSMYTYEVAPVFSLMEIYILDKLRELIGWKEGDGVFAPGGAHSNLLAILAARNAKSKHIKKQGVLPEDKLVCFTSVHSHYTIARSASVLGLGMDACIKIPVDAEGHIDVVKLDEAVAKSKAEGKTPFAICVTAGTTVLGAYDPLEKVAEVAEKHGVWLHVDACWGGHCLLSKKHRGLMKGCERADSIAWTATKCLGLPQQCSALLLKGSNVLYNCNAMHQDYLFHDHAEKDYDLGERTLNCGRRVDALKLWISWKVYGNKGFEERVDHAFDQAAYICKKIAERKDRFELLTYPESLNVCFFYIPPSARGLPAGLERSEKMSKATTVIRRQMQMEGKVLLNYSDLQDVHGHFWRLITCNPGAKESDMDFILDEIERLGSEL